MKPWPHQARGIGEVAQLIASGCKRLGFASPTGMGKSFCINEMLKWGLPSLVLCNRTMLFEQLGRGMSHAGIEFDALAPGFAQSNLENVTLGMMQTISKRWAAGRLELPPADLVFLDEAHNETGDRSQKILKHYTDRGKVTVCVTATPIGIKHMADHLVVAGRNSEGRECGALLPAVVYAPDEPDAKALKTTTKGIIQFKDEVREVMLKVITGRVLEYYFRLNPDQRPAILFAPGVAESRWITGQFMDAGIPWSHIDSKKIILNGEIMPATRTNRDRLIEASRTGETKGISNRFVMREGLDLPWLYHCIFACSFGSMMSYLQAGGRILRNHESLDDVLVVDHGGNIFRHNHDLNDDMDWELDDTEKSIKEKKNPKPPEGDNEPEAIVCPQCSHIRHSGAVCPICGHAYKGSCRIIVQTDGTLGQIDCAPKKKQTLTTKDHDAWVGCYFRCKAANLTFRQAWAIYVKENGKSPPTDSPYMPKDSKDWAKRVPEVKWSDLTSKNDTSIAQMQRLGA